jgi:polyphenol oxidase
MIERTYGDLTLLQFESLAHEAGLIHCVTTKPQNMAPHRGVGCEEAIRWRHEVCRIFGVSFDRLTSPSQVHGPDVLRVEEGDIGCGRDGRGSAVANVDGLLTDSPGVPLILMSADCPLVWMYDRQRRVVGAVHASWKGTVAGAAGHLVRRMQAEFGSDPASLLAAICPSAGPCCYEVGREVQRLARTRLDHADSFFVTRGGGLYFDLWAVNRQQLVGAGVQSDHIDVAGLCTICDPRFWSHRRDGETAGRFALWVALR